MCEWEPNLTHSLDQRGWPTADAYRALSLAVPLEVLETDIALGRQPVSRMWEWEAS